MVSLGEIYKKYSDLTDKGSDHSYLEFYEEILYPLVGKNSVLLELGVYKGGSLLLWKDYLVNAVIHGVDIKCRPQCISKDCELIKYHNINCANKEDLEKEFGATQFDVIIDDASHLTGQQIASFNILYPKLKNGGVYVIEDVVERGIEPLKAINKSANVIDMRSGREKLDNILVVYRK